MISTRDAVVLREETLPDHGAGGGTVAILRDHGRVLVKRSVARGGVVNVVDRYERVTDAGIATLLLDEEVANTVVDAVLAGRPWSAAFVVEDRPRVSLPLAWERSAEEHRYTSTGVKFWRHPEAMASYRAGGGRSVISTHVSPEGACNLRCPYCSVTYRDTHSRISLTRIKKYVSDLRSRGLKAVILTGGGEPTIYPQFNELVQWVKGEGLSVALITNGTLPHKVTADTWRCFSWVRVSINMFDGWRERIRIPYNLLDSSCVVGCSTVYTIEHEAANEEVPLDRLELFRQISGVADRCGAEYIRVLPNCLLPQHQLLLEHESIRQVAEKLGDKRYFQQYKVHGAPDADVCHQAHFRPYLSEEPFHGDGEPGTVYPCDSVVLNDSMAHFGERYQICKPEDVLDFLDGKIAQRFSPRMDCAGCVFTANVEMLGKWKDSGDGEFSDEPLVHEEFV